MSKNWFKQKYVSFLLNFAHMFQKMLIDEKMQQSILVGVGQEGPWEEVVWLDFLWLHTE